MNWINKLVEAIRVTSLLLAKRRKEAEGTLDKLLPLRMRVSSGVVVETLWRILDVSVTPSPAPAHVIVTEVFLPVVTSQVQVEIEGDGGQRQIPVVNAEKVVASVSPHIPP